MAFGNTPKDTSGTPLSSIYVPNTSGSNLTALQGGPASTDGNGQTSAPAAMSLADGADITQGTSTDASTVNSVMGRLTAIKALLSAPLAVLLNSGGNLVGGVQLIGNDNSSKLKVNGNGTLPVVLPDNSTSGTITSAGSNVEFDLTDGVGTIEFFLAGTFSSGSTIVFEQSADNTNWVSIIGRITGAVSNPPISSTVGPGPIAVLCNGVSAGHVRARCTVLQVSDSINVTIRSSVGITAVAINSSLPTGTNVIGHVIADSGSTTAVTSLPSLPAGSNTIGGVQLVDSAGTNKLGINASGQLLQSANSAWTTVYTTTQTAVSAWSGSGTISNMSQYSQLYVNIYVSALTGTSIQFKINRIDSQGNVNTLANGNSITNAVTTDKLDCGPGTSTNHFFGPSISVTASLTAITSVSFFVEVLAR